MPPLYDEKRRHEGEELTQRRRLQLDAFRPDEFGHRGPGKRVNELVFLRRFGQVNFRVQTADTGGIYGSSGVLHQPFRRTQRHRPGDRLVKPAIMGTGVFFHQGAVGQGFNRNPA